MNAAVVPRPCLHVSRLFTRDTSALGSVWKGKGKYMAIGMVLVTSLDLHEERFAEVITAFLYSLYT